MTTQFVQGWESLITDLHFFGTLENGWDGRDINAPRPLLLQNAISLAETFRDWGARPETEYPPESPN